MVASILSACAAASPTPCPTATAAPVATSVPTHTIHAQEPEPTATLEPSRTPTEEPTPLPTETLVAPELKPLDLPGFSETWNANTNRFEYVDVDRQVIAYWDQANKRVELVEELTKLDLEKHRGLFVGWSADDVLKGFEQAKTNGETRIAFMFEPVAGQVEEIKSIKKGLYFYNIPTGTVFWAPISGTVAFASMNNGVNTIEVARIILNVSDLSLRYLYPSKENYIGSGSTIEAGDKIVCSTEKKSVHGVNPVLLLR